MTAAAVRSLYRRSLRAVAFCTAEHRGWMTSYTKNRFRDGAQSQSSGLMSDAEEELQRFVRTLQHAGRLDAAASASLAKLSGASSAADPPATSPEAALSDHSSSVCDQSIELRAFD